MNTKTGTIVFGIKNEILSRLYFHYTGCPFDIIGIIVHPKLEDGHKTVYVFTALEGKIVVEHLVNLFASVPRLYFLEIIDPSSQWIDRLKQSLKSLQNAEGNFGTLEDILHLYPSRNGKTFCDLLSSSLFPDEISKDIYPKSFLGNLTIPSFIAGEIPKEEEGLYKMLNRLRSSPHNPRKLAMKGYSEYLSCRDSPINARGLTPSSLLDLYRYLALLKEEKEIKKEDLQDYRMLLEALKKSRRPASMGEASLLKSFPLKPDKEALYLVEKSLETLKGYGDDEARALSLQFAALRSSLSCDLNLFIKEMTE